MRNLSSRWSPAGRCCGTIFVAAALLVACGRQSPEQELLDQAAPVGSWISTLQMAGEKWIANSVPTSFVKTTCEAADEDLDNAAEAAVKSKARPAVRDPLRQLISQARGSGLSLRQAAAQNDRAGVARQTVRLAALRKQLADWKQSAGPP
ncbi:MAG: hypothetical protein WAM82_07560 [Thermoanaerobaculia bacterium]